MSGSRVGSWPNSIGGMARISAWMSGARSASLKTCLTRACVSENFRARSVRLRACPVLSAARQH